MTTKNRRGWAKEFDQMQNDRDDAHGADGILTDGLGDEMDTAFRRGREYFTKGYALSAVKAASKKKTPEYKKEFIRGWKWQKARKDSANEKEK